MSDKKRPHRPVAAARLAALEEIEVEIEKLVAGGDGLGRFEGIPVFVPRSAPGDRLRVRLTERQADYGRGEILEILSPGASRREAPCPHYARCGGCDLQHIEEAQQIRFKAAAAAETLKRIGGIDWPPETRVVTGDTWGYRLRTQLQVEAPEEVDSPDAVTPGTRPRVGYFAAGSHDLVPVEQCPVLVPELEEQVRSLPKALGPVLPSRIDLTAGADGQVTAAPRLEGLPEGEVETRVGDLVYRYDARCFFQAHRGLVDDLVKVAVGPWKGEEAVDLYGGVGLFGLALARRYAKVTTVEGDRIASRFARQNARRNKLANVEVVGQAVESWIRQLPEGVERMLVDPPRAGLARGVRRALFAKPPRRLTYVSCHPATLARDLRMLKDRYTLESITLLDLFPQTGHLETVVQLALDSDVESS